jgi:glycosyltransferase involved in cell wall biosynthesis
MSRTQGAKAFLRRELAFMAMRGSEVVVVPSKAMGDYLRSWRGCPRSASIEVVPHGINLDRFRFIPTPRSNRVRIVALGDEYPHKDHGLLVDMMGELRRREVEAILELTVRNDDSLRHVAALRERIRATGLEKRIRLVGRVDAPSFLADADVMVMPSVTESFGFPILEAMASGVPVVASSIPATMELLGDLGSYFPVGDAIAAADGVVSILEADPSKIRLQVESAREVACRYTWEANARRIAGLIESVAETIVAGVMFGLLGQHEHQHVLEAGAFALAAGSIGFAPFNFPTARVFLADVGSYFAGAWLAVLIAGYLILPSLIEHRRSLPALGGRTSWVDR